jgi:hypothetical protein
MTAVTALEQRLAKGWEMCEQERDLNRKSELERHWLDLLRQYEALVDQDMSESGVAA